MSMDRRHVDPVSLEHIWLGDQKGCFVVVEGEGEEGSEFMRNL